MNKMLLALPLMMLAACDNGPKVEAENASVEEVAEKVREANADDELKVRPGKWQTSVTLETIDVPGMPPEAAAEIKKTMASAVSGHQTCLTAEQARKPKEDFFAGAGSNCRYDKFSMDGGKISGTMRCTHQGGTQMIEFDGTYSPEEYHMRMASTLASGSSPGGPMKMVMSMASNRIGECDTAADTGAAN
jgi:hypothetical protein